MPAPWAGDARRHQPPCPCEEIFPVSTPRSAPTSPASDFAIGTGRIAGVDPREMGVSDLVVIWGTNPVNTQVNVMTHAMRARKERGAKIAAIDVYNNDTMKQADIKILLRPAPTAPSPAASCTCCSARVLRIGPIWSATPIARMNLEPAIR